MTTEPLWDDERIKSYAESDWTRAPTQVVIKGMTQVRDDYERELATLRTDLAALQQGQVYYPGLSAQVAALEGELAEFQARKADRTRWGYTEADHDN